MARARQASVQKILIPLFLFLSSELLLLLLSSLSSSGGGMYFLVGS